MSLKIIPGFGKSGIRDGDHLLPFDIRPVLPVLTDQFHRPDHAGMVAVGIERSDKDHEVRFRNSRKQGLDALLRVERLLDVYFVCIDPFFPEPLQKIGPEGIGGAPGAFGATDKQRGKHAHFLTFPDPDTPEQNPPRSHEDTK